MGDGVIGGPEVNSVETLFHSNGDRKLWVYLE